MLLLKLYWEFFKVGLFAVGGGLATLPFLYEMAGNTGWFTTQDISTMVAISESTPGPLGINMGTYVGFMSAGPLGCIVAPLGLVSPSLIVIIIVANFLKKFKENKIVQSVFYGLRPASTALIAAAGIGIVKLAFFNTKLMETSIKDAFFWKGAILAIVLFIAMKKIKVHPVAYIAISAVIGVIFKFNI